MNGKLASLPTETKFPGIQKENLPKNATFEHFVTQAVSNGEIANKKKNQNIIYSTNK